MPEELVPDKTTNNVQDLEDMMNNIDKHARSTKDSFDELHDNLKNRALKLADKFGETIEKINNDLGEQEDELPKFFKIIDKHERGFKKFSIASMAMLAATVAEYHSMSRSISNISDKIGVIDKRLLSWYKTSRNVSTEFALYNLDVEDVMENMQAIMDATNGLVLSGSFLKDQVKDLTELQAHWNISSELLGDIYSGLVIKNEEFKGLSEDIYDNIKDSGLAAGVLFKQIESAGDVAKILLVTMGPRGVLGLTKEIAKFGGNLSETLEYGESLWSDISGQVKNAAQFSALFSGSIDLVGRRMADAAGNFEMIAKSNRRLVEQNMDMLMQPGRIGIVSQKKFAEMTGMSIEQLHKMMTKIRLENANTVEEMADVWRDKLNKGEIVTFADILNQLQKMLSTLFQPLAQMLLPVLSQLADVTNRIVSKIMVFMDRHPVISKFLMGTALILSTIIGGLINLLIIAPKIISFVQMLKVNIDLLSASTTKLTASLGLFALAGMAAIYLIMNWNDMNKWLRASLSALIPVLIAFGIAMHIGMGPIGWIITGIAALTIGIIALVNNFEKVKNWIMKWGPLIATVLTGGLFMPLMFGIKLVMKNLDALKSAFTKIKNFVIKWAKLLIGPMLMPFVGLIYLLNKLPWINIPLPKWALDITGISALAGGNVTKAMEAERGVNEAKNNLQTERERVMIRETATNIKLQPQVVTQEIDVNMDSHRVGKGFSKTSIA